MSSDRTRVIAVFAAVALVAGAAGFYFLGVYRPKQILADAQAEVIAWETRWKAARDCLLGPSPGSSKTAEALAIREMSPDPWNRGSCTPLMGKLVRDAQQQSGIEDVEVAWAELETAAGKAAQAFATHVATSTTRLDDPLPAALDALDAAHAKLRTVAKLPAAEQGGKPLPVAEIVPIADGSEPLEELHVDSPPSAHGVVLFGRTSSRIVQVTLTAGAAPKVARKGPGALRAVPDGSWGASPGDTGIRVGAMDVEGAMAAPVELKLAGALPLAAAGTLQDGLVLAGSDKQLVVAHLANGALTTEPAIAIVTAAAATDADGSVAAFWIAPDRSSHARTWRGGKATDVTLEPDATPPMCFASDRLYTEHRSELTLIGCTPDGSVARGGGDPQVFSLCTAAGCRPASLPAGAPTFATTTVVGGKLVAAVEHGGVLAVWREGGGATYFALPSPAHPIQAQEWPAMALTDGKVIDILARGVKGFSIVRIPAR